MKYKTASDTPHQVRTFLNQCTYSMLMNSNFIKQDILRVCNQELKGTVISIERADWDSPWLFDVTTTEGCYTCLWDHDQCEFVVAAGNILQ